ncbi:MAG TPA: glycosyltransferase family 4 protein, partial [Actinomycetota bacterium]|nr:glycosyltransferase family 4 protein [Actinomycetota bacterium]
GFGVAIDAFARLAGDRPDVRFVVVGDGPERTAAERLPVAVRERALLMGTVANEDLPSLHAACDVFVAPNLGGESFGIVLVEAMAAGLPVVASAIPGFTEVVRDGVEGLLVRPGDAAATAAAIARVLDDRDLAARLADAGRERVSRYSWDTVVPAVEAAYARAAERGR